MSETTTNKGKLVAVCIVWLMLVGVGALIWKVWIVPSREAAQQTEEEQAEAEAERKAKEERKKAEEAKKKRERDKGSESYYHHQVRLALDSFSGYCVLRSKAFLDHLRTKRIKLTIIDDKADYPQRLKSLADGEVNMAAFTIDALIKTCAQQGDMPATIVAILDETRGADAMVAYKKAFPNVDSLNDKDVKLVLTPDSPSETLARLLMADYELENLGPTAFAPAKDAESVYEAYRAAKPTDRQVYVLWEPFVSKLLENPETHVITDSSKFRGIIVDVLVVSEDYLRKKPEVVQDVLAAYFSALDEHRQGMVELVHKDAEKFGAELTSPQAERLVQGVWWKNTQENFAHLGLHASQQLQLLEDMIDRITRVLLSTGAISNDPTNGSPNKLYHNDILHEMQKSGWRPGQEDEDVRDDTIMLPKLTADEVKNLKKVGRVKTPNLVFARGSDRLTGYSLAVLDELIKTLQNWPHYYVLIRGNALQKSDQPLAEKRAKAAADHLIQHGVHENRIYAVGIEPSGTTSVSFEMRQTPY